MDPCGILQEIFPNSEIFKYLQEASFQKDLI